MTLNFKDLKANWQPQPVQVVINDSSFDFFGLGATQLVRFKDVFVKLAAANAKLESSIGSFRDQGSRTEDVKDVSGGVVQLTETQPINPDLARLRSEQAVQAQQEMLETLLSSQTLDTFAQMIAASLKVEKSERDDFINWLLGDDIPIDTFKLFVAGVLEANEKAFGDLGKRLTAFLRNEKPLVPEEEIPEGDPMATAGPTISDQVGSTSSSSAAGSPNEPSGSSTKDTIQDGSTPSTSEPSAESTQAPASSPATVQPQS